MLLEPVLVGLDRQCPHQPQAALAIGEDAHDMGAALGADVRRAMALSIDRRAFIDIISEGQGDIGGVMQPLPEGLSGIPEEVLKTLPGYAPDVQKNRAEAREIMRNLGYCPDRRLQLKVSTRNIPPYRDPAVLVTDQLKEVFVDGELEIVETRAGFPRSRARTT